MVGQNHRLETPSAPRKYLCTPQTVRDPHRSSELRPPKVEVAKDDFGLFDIEGTYQQLPKMMQWNGAGPRCQHGAPKLPTQELFPWTGQRRNMSKKGRNVRKEVRVGECEMEGGRIPGLFLQP